MIKKASSLFAALLVVSILAACNVAGIYTPTAPQTTGTPDTLPITRTSDTVVTPTPKGSTAPAQQLALPDVPTVVEKAMPSVVSVIVQVQARDVFGRPTESTGRGSGVIFDQRGYVLTNNHVVEGATKVDVVMSDGQRYTVQVVGADPNTDLAVLKLDPTKAGKLSISPLGDTEAMRIGEWVIAIGNPLGFEGSVTVGIVSAKGRTLDESSTIRLYDLIQTDAVINPGNSGGPLLNLRGEVIGINTAIIRGQLPGGQEAEGIGFAISMTTARPVAEQIIQNGRVIWPYLGISVQTVNPVLAAEQGFSVDRGVLVAATVSGGPASRAGIRSDDIIVSIRNDAVSSIADLQRLRVSKLKVGDTVPVTIVRGAERLTVNVQLIEQPTN